MNLSQQKRERLLNFIKELKLNNSFDEKSLIELNEIENELNGKKYGLVWEEHEEAVDIQMKEAVPIFVEDKSKEIVSDKDEPFNFLLEGDNLHSLYLLEKTHKGKIDVIYIDPPYNTGKGNDEEGETDGFVYNDEFVDINDSFLHSKWLSFMEKRLNTAKKLLKKDGIIFISIGKEEVSNLRLLCDEIFGSDNLLGQVVRRTKTTSFRGNFFALRVDYLLCYSLNPLLLGKFNDYVDENDYTKIEVSGKYKGMKYKDDTAFYLSTLQTRPNQRYYVECPDGELVIPPGSTMPALNVDGGKCVPNSNDKVWRWECEQYKSKKQYLSFKKTKTSPLINSKGEKASWNVYTKSFYCDKKDDGNIPQELLLDFINRNGSEELKKLGLNFSFPKPVSLIKFLIYITHKPKDCIVLDFFAGSGTTAQAVLELNNDDDGNRKFILCTNNENQICEEVTMPRIKTVITGKRADGSKYSDGLPANLKYFKTDFVSKASKNLSKELTKHVKELIELEWGVSIDKKVNLMVMTEDELDKVEANWDKLKTTVKSIYRARQVVYTGKQKQLFKNINNFIIPDYYFNNELKEVGENW